MLHACMHVLLSLAFFARQFQRRERLDSAPLGCQQWQRWHHQVADLCRTGWPWCGDPHWLHPHSRGRYEWTHQCCHGELVCSCWKCGKRLFHPYVAAIAQSVEHPAKKLGTILMQVWVPGAARDFSPVVNFQCRLCLTVPMSHVTAHVQSHNMPTFYVNICAHVFFQYMNKWLCQVSHKWPLILVLVWICSLFCLDMHENSKRVERVDANEDG